jgi:hypothetical protein
MKLARIIFTGAGIWGVTVLTPLFWLVDITGRRYPPPVDYPQFFYGFMAVALAWQIAFLLIGSNPARFRSLMIPAMIEKFGYVSTLFVLYAKSLITSIDLQPAIPDGILGMLFVVAFVKTRGVERTRNGRE